MERLNVICICLDTLRADIVGPGQKLSHVRTPNMDSLASAGITFDRAYGEGQPTLQNRRSFFTGQRSFPWRFNYDRRGHWHHAPGWHKIPPEQDTLAEQLVARGYMTGLVADTYHMFKPTMNYTRGFTTYDFIRGQESDNWRYGDRATIQDTVRRHVREPIDWNRHTTLVQYLFNQRFRQREEDYSCARVLRRAADWVEENAANSPFFLWIDAFDPHEPWDPPTAYADQYMPGYDGKDFLMPGAAYEQGQPTPEELERIKALYFGEVSLVDRWVGHLFQRLERLGLWSDTAVLLLSDHGTQVLDHGSFGKGPDRLHPYNTRINWIMRHPDLPGGQHVHSFVQSHDLAPTLLHMLELPGSEFSGQSVWTLARGSQDPVRDHVVIGWAAFSDGSARARVSVRDDIWNYTVTVDDLADQEELFDLERDPDENTNVAVQHPEVVQAQRTRIEAVIGQPLPARFQEVCDHPVPSPLGAHLAGRVRLLQKR